MTWISKSEITQLYEFVFFFRGGRGCSLWLSTRPHSYIPTKRAEGPLFSPHPLQLADPGHCRTAILTDEKQHLLIALICSSLMCLGASCISSVEKCLVQTVGAFFKLGWAKVIFLGTTYTKMNPALIWLQSRDFYEDTEGSHHQTKMGLLA